MQTLHTIAQMSAERMLNCLAQGMLIALFAWVVLRVVGRRNSGTRFAVWFCALLAIAATPFLQIPLAGAARSAHISAAVTLPANWAFYLFAAWATIAALAMARVVAGLWHLRAIRKNCQAVAAGELDPLLQATLAEFRSARPVEFCISEELRVPAALGFFKPAVVVPAWALHELSPTELNSILLHELAHLRRWDDWTNLAQKLLRAVFFFHPAVLWVESRLSLEREMACDDLVVAQTANPHAYAQCLVSLAEKNVLLRRGMALAQAAVGRMRQTTQRVLHILDARGPSGVRVWKPAPWLVGAFSVLCLVSSGNAPRLIAFGDTSHESQFASAAVAGRSVDFGQSATPHFVSATFVEHPISQRSMSAPSAHQSAKPVAQPAKPALLKAENRENTRPVPTSTRVVEARVSAASEQVVAQPAVFVVVEGQQYGNAVVWQVSYWRVMIVTPSPHTVSTQRLSPRAASENPSKSI